MYLGIDLGTSGVKSLLIDESQTVVAVANAPLTVTRPNEGWSEQEPADWISATTLTFEELASKHGDKMSAVTGIGLSGQQHGATLIAEDDSVIRPCILWNDGRSTAEAERLNTELFQSRCGSIIFPGFTAPKLLWVKQHEPRNFERVAKALLPKDYLRLWLTGEYVSEMSDASGTGWLDVSRRDWCPELLENADMQASQMPRLVEGTEVSGTLRQELASRFKMQASVVVAGGAGDNAASACGMGMIEPGRAFASLGTSGVVFASNSSFLPNPASAVHAFCHAVPDTWHQMGVILSATDCLNWYAGITGTSPAELTSALEEAADGKLLPPSSVTFLPYLSGERTPHNNAGARGSFVGLSHSSDREQLTQAVLTGVAFAFRDNVQALRSAGTELDSVTAIGGGSRSDYWLKMIATVLDLPVKTAVDGDFGAGFGAARLGMLAATGADPKQICTAPEVDKVFEPDPALKNAYQEAHQRFGELYPAVH